MSCSRCGKTISIHEFVKNVRTLKVLGEPCFEHFCDSCFDKSKDEII